MKLALLGDVHGNADALNAVLSAAHKMGVEEVLNTGDLIGYYYRPADVLAQLNSWPCHSVRGNHDDMLEPAARDAATMTELTAKYGHGLSCAVTQFTSHDRTWLEALPRKQLLRYGAMRILLCHGSPWDTDCYVYPDASEAILTRIMEDVGSEVDLVVLGHTHYQNLWHCDGLRIVNPGSVGQPRDHKSGAAWALLDTLTGQIDLRREIYNTRPTEQEAHRWDPQLSYLWTVLTRQ